MSSSSHFYTDLSINNVSLSQLLDDVDRFARVPADWHVVVTDIKNSTAAFKSGRHEEVNLIATGSIIATLNLARKSDIEVPFFFGGDGATLIVPQKLLGPVVQALTVHRENTLSTFDLDLRVGAVPVADLYTANHELKISRLLLSESFTIPVLLGSGLSEAERIVKANDPSQIKEWDAEDLLDLEGMECRWDRVAPGQTFHEVVSLVVTATENSPQAPIFKRVVDLIDDIYGPAEARNPISTAQLKLKGSKIALEMRTRLGRFDYGYLVRNWLITQFGRFFFFRKESGRYYMQKLVELVDTLVIDGRINTVIAGTPDQRNQLEEELAQMEQEGSITYGLFVSRESIMSCYIRDRKDKHIHFVDGSDGGYTMAATMWKQKKQKG